MRLLDDSIENYAQTYTSPESEGLAALNRETHLKVMMPQMLSGHIQGSFLSMISYMLRPKRVLEVGTYTGYSGICMAKGLAPDGALHSIDINEELTDMVQRYVDKEGLSDKMKLHVGNALDIIPTLNEEWDLVFIDADKINYANYYDMVIDKVRPGGFIIADNVLWSGKVLQDEKDKDTQALHDYNEKIQSDMRVENILLPIRDGLMVARKR